MRVASGASEDVSNAAFVLGDTSFTQPFDFPSEVTLMSMTDASSHVLYANSAFLSVSGFSLEEMLGRPHNIVRHPDMPKQAFADLWATIRRGDAWTALIKNRRADGLHHYWVRANVTPVRNGDAIVGYMSVRTRPSDDEVRQASALYKRFRGGRARGLAFHKGLIVRKGLLGWTRIGQVLPVRWRIRLALGGIVAAGLAQVAVAGLPWHTAWPVAAAALAACIWLEQRVSRPLSHVLKQAKAVAAGQPGVGMHLNRVDEIGMTLRALNQSSLNLRALVGDVAAQMRGMSQGSQQIAQGNQALKQHAEQTRQRLRETAATAEQIAAVAESGVQSAQQARKLTDHASEAVAHGGQVLGAVVDSLKDIERSNSQVADINNLIDGIAFQTNLLALNAAVEAARAGQAGRGFAVVATEIRNLAQRSANAAKDVRRLIESNIEKSSRVAGQAEEAGQAMATIIDRVRSVNALIEKLSGGAEEQSVGVAQVNEAVAQVDAMTRENAHLVGQASEATEILLARTQRLMDAVHAFDRENILGGGAAPSLDFQPLPSGKLTLAS